MMWNWLYRPEGWEQNVNIQTLGEIKMKTEETRKPKEVIAILYAPIRTGMLLAFGFVLTSILLTFLGWLVIGASCAAMMNQF